MRRIRWVYIAVGALLTLLLLTGCGSTIPTSASGAPTTMIGTPSSRTATPTGQTEGGAVTLQTNAPVYQAGDTITVTVNNQSNQTISFSDHLTNCSVILLQREKIQPQASDNGQAGINPCTSAIATHIHALGPGERLMVTLTAPQSGWPVGLYRAILSYRTSLTAGPSITLSSTVFTIGPLVPQP